MFAPSDPLPTARNYDAATTVSVVEDNLFLGCRKSSVFDSRQNFFAVKLNHAFLVLLTRMNVYDGGNFPAVKT
jgi:hypothetical protein